jgi:hypothetical protein
VAADVEHARRRAQDVGDDQVALDRVGREQDAIVEQAPEAGENG